MPRYSEREVKRYLRRELTYVGLPIPAAVENYREPVIDPDDEDGRDVRPRPRMKMPTRLLKEHGISPNADGTFTASGLLSRPRFMTAADFRRWVQTARAQMSAEQIAAWLRLSEDEVWEICAIGLTASRAEELGFVVVNAYEDPSVLSECRYVLPDGAWSYRRLHDDPHLYPIRLIDTHSRSCVVEPDCSERRIELQLREIFGDDLAKEPGVVVRPASSMAGIRLRPMLRMKPKGRVAKFSKSQIAIKEPEKMDPVAEAPVALPDPVPAPKTKAPRPSIQLDLFVDPNDHPQGPIIRHMSRKMKMSVDLIADTLDIKPSEIELVLAGKWKPAPRHPDVDAMVRRIGVRWTAVALRTSQKRIRELVAA